MKTDIALLIAVLSTLSASAIAESDLIKVDVSGRHGNNGQNGYSHTGSAGTNRDGSDGGNAGTAEAGQSAGNLHLKLQSDGKGGIVLKGKVTSPAGKTAEMNQSAIIGTKGGIPLLTVGGNGGAGGSGGNGEDGGRGSDGSDATRYSWGTSGDNGGDGGRGGNATSGERGGNGGKISVHVSEDDTHLLMLLEPAFEGGVGGQPGSNGRGGDGGRGGSGGSSYSWTETDSYTTTDSDGKSTTHYNTTYHSNPGGSDGSRGRSGSPGSASVRAGEDGKEGDLTLLVGGAAEATLYKSRYDMKLLGFDVREANQDKINEPREKITVSKIRIKNTGGMPTPPNHPVTIHLGQSQWVTPEKAELTVPKSLAPGEEYVFTKEVLNFDIPNIKQTPTNRALNEPEVVRPLADQTGVNRPYTGFDKPHDFTVSFPIRISAVKGLESMTPGQASRMKWVVENISTKPFGSASELKRAISTQLGLNNPEMAEHVVLMDSDGLPLSWDKGFLAEIANLAPGEKKVIDGIVGVMPGAPGYSRADIATRLNLGKIETPAEQTAIQDMVFPVRVAKAYDAVEAADMLLVTNHETTTAEIAQWEASAKAKGQKLAVWDVSLNDSLSLTQAQAEGHNLMRAFRGKTIVLLNNKFQTSQGEKHADELLSQMDLITAAADNGIRLVVVNEKGHDVSPFFKERLIPTQGEAEKYYDSTSAFWKDKKDAVNSTSEIKKFGFFAPKESRLASQAEAIQKKLELQNPGKRVVVKYALPTEAQKTEKKDGYIYDSNLQGTITVLPTVGDKQPNVIVIESPSEVLHTPKYISSKLVDAALNQGLSFEMKISHLNSALIHQEGDRAHRLIDSILADLATEQASVMKSGWKSGLSGSKIRKSLTNLALLRDRIPSITKNAGAKQMELLARLTGGLEFLGNNQARWYERLPLPWGGFRRGPTLRAETLSVKSALEKNIYKTLKPEWKDLREQITFQVDKLELASKSKRQEGDTLREAANHTLMTQVGSGQMQLDTTKPFDRLLPEGTWNAIQVAEQTKQEGRLAFQEIKQKAQADLLVPGWMACLDKFKQMKH